MFNFGPGIRSSPSMISHPCMATCPLQARWLSLGGCFSIGLWMRCRRFVTWITRLPSHPIFWQRCTGGPVYFRSGMGCLSFMKINGLPMQISIFGPIPQRLFLGPIGTVPICWVNSPNGRAANQSPSRNYMRLSQLWPHGARVGVARRSKFD